MSGTPTTTTNDAVRVRALAHPLRLRLLDVLDGRGEATATECAEATGESVASCAFHLGTLAKHGFVEPAPRRGREKPWRSVARSRSAVADPADPASVAAVVAIAGLTVSREAARFAAWAATAATEPSEWLLASTVSTSTFWATADELRELSAQVAALTDRFAHRSEDPALRPDGARPARLLGVVHPDPQ